MDGGDITFDSYDENAGTVYLYLMGACSGCPSAQMTLKDGIETRLRQEFPEINDVVRIN
jgi:Fe-S cluster biogenesis protein NfuA